eukprot:GHVL01030375.1.p1 GENE.GHVL01030375.1~~GHVL01030375.1.p1  ORF type:complete len:102 (+),score=2.86 GHVL01030375.1:990-1295(+)
MGKVVVMKRCLDTIFRFWQSVVEKKIKKEHSSSMYHFAVLDYWPVILNFRSGYTDIKTFCLHICNLTEYAMSIVHCDLLKILFNYHCSVVVLFYLPHQSIL